MRKIRKNLLQMQRIGGYSPMRNITYVSFAHQYFINNLAMRSLHSSMKKTAIVQPQHKVHLSHIERPSQSGQGR